MLAGADEQVPHLVVRVLDHERDRIEPIGGLQARGGAAQQVRQGLGAQQLDLLFLRAAHHALVERRLVEQRLQARLHVRQLRAQLRLGVGGGPGWLRHGWLMVAAPTAARGGHRGRCGRPSSAR